MVQEKMELPEEPEVFKKCYKIEHQLLDNLNIFYNTSSSTIVLWNKFQIFVYEDLNFENTSRIFVPEFQLHKLILYNNYLLCLDCSGNIHTTSLKFKNPAQKRFKSSFQPRLHAVVACIQIQESVLSLIYENGVYYLYLNKINSDFQLENKITLKYTGRWPLPGPSQSKSILSSHRLTTEELNYVAKIFNTKESITNPCYLTVMSFDKLSLNSCLIDPKRSDDDAILVKLYSCPSEICSIEIVSQDGLCILIGLKIGTIIRLSLKNVLKKAGVVHLNTALSKYVTIKDSIVYTDGRSLWKTENVFKENIVFSQFFLRHVKDFIKFGDQLICTSFSNMLYVFPIDDDSSFVKQETVAEYCAAEKLLNNSEYVYKIMEEVEKNNELTKKINNEGNYITAFSISKRQDIMDNIVHHSVKVYESYEDVIKDHTDITLTENMYEYFKPNSFYFLVTLTAVSLHHIFNNILSNILNDVKIHITFSTNVKLFKTTSIKVTETFKKIKILLPFDVKDEDVSEINVNIKLVSSIPGAFDERQKLWVTLFRKQIVLKSEHFIKPNVGNKNYLYLKEPTEPIRNMIYKSALTQYGSLFNISDISKYHLNAPEFSVYGRLSIDYKDIFKDESLIIRLEHLNKKKAMFILDQIKSEEFLKSESNLCFQVGKLNVKLEIINDDFTNPLLKVTSMNMLVALYIRNFITSLIYDNAAVAGTANGYVKYTLYNTTEKILKDTKMALLNHHKYEDFKPIADNFERNVFGALPI